jgi:hypothetical protein
MASNRNKNREELPNERREMTPKWNKDREELLEERREMPKWVKKTTPNDNVEGTVYTTSQIKKNSLGLFANIPGDLWLYSSDLWRFKGDFMARIDTN